jgi:hypothetical protein
VPEDDGAAEPDGGDSGVEGLDAVADELYGLPPDEFVPARDDRAAAARSAGDRELARAIGRLRRPTRAAWLANLLARHRAEQLDGLVSLSRGLAQAQQELDGDALRALSGQRHRLVAAMAREAARLARGKGEAVSDALLRELQGILDAALADPAVAEQVRAGRLTKTVSYAGFGPEDGGSGDDMAAWLATAAPKRAPAQEPRTAPPSPPAADDEAERAAAERAARERQAAERAERERALAEGEAQEAEARRRQEADEATRDRAEERHAAARERVAELVAELDRARREEQEAMEAVRAAASAARESARAAAAAAVRAARARTRLEQLPPTAR